MLAGIHRTQIVGQPLRNVVHLHPPEAEILNALATVGALVALADGFVADAERDVLVEFSTRQGFVSRASESELGRVFDDRVEQLKKPACSRIVRQSLRPLVRHFLASVVVRTAEKVAAADGIVHPGELRALDVIRRVMKVHALPNGSPRIQKRETCRETPASNAQMAQQ